MAFWFIFGKNGVRGSLTLRRLFTSIGGLDSTEAIDTRSSGGDYVRRRNILENDNNIEQGIELAFHPFIEMKGYPGPERASVGNNTQQ